MPSPFSRKLIAGVAWTAMAVSWPVIAQAKTNIYIYNCSNSDGSLIVDAYNNTNDLSAVSDATISKGGEGHVYCNESECHLKFVKDGLWDHTYWKHTSHTPWYAHIKDNGKIHISESNICD